MMKYVIMIRKSRFEKIPPIKIAVCDCCGRVAQVYVVRKHGLQFLKEEIDYKVEYIQDQH